ncbi:Protein MSN5 [Apiospora saccharicola]|uniref:Protein MSN5 n=1 Tax=Apiospora saccharicola TaxID=335842 RepID=A0ABR1U3I8_9PEZI
MSAAQVNGNMGMVGTVANGVAVIPRIQEALQLVHNPYSNNDTRQEAQRFLEEVKDSEEAPFHGYTLAADKAQSPVVRHYALSLLEHAIKHKWAKYTPDQAVALRNWVLELSRSISREDPVYLRNKIAVLWVEVTKRSWANEDGWMGMDTMLVQLWQVPDSAVHKELVLLILETLSDEIFNGDDAVVAIREGILSKAAVEIFTPAAVLVEHFPERKAGPNVRCGEEGWLGRITVLLRQCLAMDLQNADLRSCAVRAFAVLYSLMPWVVPYAATATGCVGVMCDGLRAPHLAVQKAALDAMHSLYSRTSFVDQEFLDLVVPLYDRKYAELFRQLFEWSQVDAEDIDDDKYQFGKKLSELISFVANYIDRRWQVLPLNEGRVDLPAFLQLLLLVTQSPSLIVSIPVLVTWTRLLNQAHLGPNIAQTPEIIGPLLDVCSSRQFRYENLPEDTQDPTFLFLLEDTDTLPERHAFLGNYRRYSCQVIEGIVRHKPVDAISHILGHAQPILDNLYDGQSSFNPATYTKFSAASLRADAQATVIEAALKGFCKWRARSATELNEGDVATVEASLESWAEQLLTKKFEDPLIRKRILQLLVAFSTTALDRKPTFMLKVLEHILVTWPATQPEHRAYTDAVKDLQSESMVELQRLAVKMPDHLLEVYDQISSKVGEMVASGTLDEKRQITYQTFLFTIIHRSDRVEKPMKLQKLAGFLQPIKAQWQTEDLKQALSSYTGFCQMMGLDKAQNYLARKRVHEINDWGSVGLDAEGQALQNELEERQAALPLRPTKSFLSCSIDKVEKGTAPYETSCELWQDAFPAILPELLKFLSYAHASHSAGNWEGLPTEMQGIVSRVLTDRFWQAGISEGTKDDFYARVVDKKLTFEGLASTIRGTIRFVRESVYAVIYCMSRLDMQFYGFGELPGPLAHSLLADCHSLSSHQMINLLNLVRYLVDNCPVQLRDHFLPPLLASTFQQMDTKVNLEWEKQGEQQGVRAGGEALTEEMKAESILRQLTYTAVMMVADFLDPARTSKWNPGKRSTEFYIRSESDLQADDPVPESAQQPKRKYLSLRKFCLSHSTILEPLLLFCTHAIRVRDTRCCSIMLRVFRTIPGEFMATETSESQFAKMDDDDDGKRELEETAIPASTASTIREYISSNVLKACITSIHEPYFVDLQKDLAALIATILAYYAPLTSTPRDVLLSLPNIKPNEVDRILREVLKSNNSRNQRGHILELLKDLKGVSISEMGKLAKSINIQKPSSKNKPSRSRLAQQFMTANGSEEQGLEDVASLFNS